MSLLLAFQGGAQVFVEASDSLFFSDSVDRLVALPRGVSDSAAFSDSAERLVSLPRPVSDSFPFGDQADRLLGLAVAAADALVPSDLADRVLALPRQAADVLAFSDVAGRLVGLPRAALDASVLLDVALQLVSLPRAASDSFSFGDQASIQGLVSASDSLQASELALGSAVQAEVMGLPVTVLADIAANGFYPDSYRLRAAVALLLSRNALGLRKDTVSGTTWIDTLIALKSAQGAGFAGYIERAQALVLPKL